MKVFCCYTRAHEVLLHEHFLPTLPNDVQLHAIPLSDIHGKGDFLSSEFLDCIKRKMELIEDSLMRNNGSIIVWTDIDIIFYRSFAEDVVAFMEQNQLDMAFQKEGYGKWDAEVNTGFIAMRCNDRVRAFYKRVRETLRANPEKNEQPVVNEILADDPGIAWKMLPVHYTACSHGWPPQPDMTLYHANVTAGKDGVGQKIRQFTELHKMQPNGRHKICVVSPECIGPRRNSGIGTHTYHLLKFLAAQPDTEVTLLLTAEIQVPCDEGWERWFRHELGVHFVHLEPQPHRYAWVGWFNHWFVLRSLQVFNYLRRSRFSVVHFQDLNGDGFVSCQARRTGQAFAKTVFTAMINGPASWARDGMKQFVENEVYESMLKFCEGYVLGAVDLLMAPSQYALDYARNHTQWNLAAHQRVCPYMLDLPENAASPPAAAAPARSIIFFGRLETRKGIMYFLQALERLHRADAPVPREVVFLGAHAPTGWGPSEKVIPEFFAARLPGWSFTIHADKGQPEAIEVLRANRDSVVVLPSIHETLGYTAIECLALGMNVIAADTGAFPEVFADRARLFELNSAALARKLREAVDGKLPPPRGTYDPQRARSLWQDVHDWTLQASAGRYRSLQAELPRHPLVTVCLPHFNYAAYLPEQIASLAAQSYTNFELIAIDDGSSDPESRRVFDELAARYGSERWRFLTQENRGLCATRNRAASEARGEFLVFVDADNISRHDMIERLVEGIESSGADCVTCHFAKFRIEPDGRRVELDHYTPVGGCVEVGAYVDPFGDANFIIRKRVFEALGGFRHVPQTASEDWEFLAELVLSGYRLEVLPDDLFFYREHSESNMRVTNSYDTRLRVYHPYLRRVEDKPWLKEILNHAFQAWESRLATQRREHEWMAYQHAEIQKLNEEIRKQGEWIQGVIQGKDAIIRDLTDAHAKETEEAARRLREAHARVQQLERLPLHRLSAWLGRRLGRSGD